MPHQCTGCGHAFEDGSKEMLSGCPECGGNKFQFRPEGEPLPDDPDPPDGPPGPDAPDATGADERSPAREAGSVAETVGRATTKVRDFVSTNPNSTGTDPTSPPDPERSWPSEADAATDEADDRSRDRESGPPAGSDDEKSDGEIIDADARRDERDGLADDEDVAQASARSDVVTNDELDDARQRDGTAGSGPRSSPGEPQSLDGPDVGGDSEVAGQPSGDDSDLSELREQLNDQFESIKILEPGQYELNLMELYDREEYIIALQENGRYVIQVPDQWIGDDLDDR